MTEIEKHTAGPWRFNWETNEVLAGNSVVIWCPPGSYQGDGDFEANARLIAAAPDLLEELKEAKELLLQTLRWRREGWECSEDELLGSINSVIAKATKTRP